MDDSAPQSVGVLITQSLISLIGLLLVLVVLSSAFAGCFTKRAKKPEGKRSD